MLATISGVEIKIDQDDLWRLLKNKYRIKGEYIVRNKKINKKSITFWLHREIMNTSAGMECDHINGDTKDCQKQNLRNCLHSENIRNTKLRKDNLIRLKGVTWKMDKRKWRARIKINKKEFHLGYFKTPQEAHSAYCKAAMLYYGEYARIS